MDKKKLEFSSIPSRPSDPKEVVTAIVKVTRPDYVPQGVQVRSRIDPTMFTGSFLAEQLAKLQADPLVASISTSSRLRMID